MKHNLTGLYKLAADVAPSITKRGAVTAWPEQPGVPTAPVDQPKRIPGLAFNPDAPVTTGTPPMMPMLGGPANAVAAAGGRAMQAVGNGMRSALRAAPGVGAKMLRGGVNAAKWGLKNWWSPAKSLIQSPSRTVRNIGRAYRGLLGATQTFGPWAMAAQSDETLSKLPSWAKKLPAYTQLLSPQGLKTSLVSYLAGKGVGARPDIAASAGEAAARAGKNIVEHSFASDEVPLIPRLGRWSPSTRENFTAGITSELGKRDPRLEGQITGAASNAYDKVTAQLPPETQEVVKEKLPWSDFEQKLDDFYKLSPQEKLERIKRMPAEARDRLAQAREGVTGRIADYSGMTPEEAELAQRFGRDIRAGVPILGQDIRDIGQIFGTNDVNRLQLAGDIAGRTAPVMFDSLANAQEAARLYRERMANREKLPTVGQ